MKPKKVSGRIGRNLLIEPLESRQLLSVAPALVRLTASQIDEFHPYTLTAQVTAPSGSTASLLETYVDFMDGTTLLGSGHVALSSDSGGAYASLDDVSTIDGTITAEYEGNSYFAPASSPPLSLPGANDAVNQATPSPLTDGSLVLNVAAGGQKLIYVSGSATAKASVSSDIVMNNEIPIDALSAITAAVSLDDGTPFTTNYSEYNILNDSFRLYPGTLDRFAVPVSGVATGTYSFDMTVTKSYIDSYDDDGLWGPGEATGTVNILNRSSSPFGQGWTLAGLDSLTSAGLSPSLTSSVTYVQSDGTMGLFTSPTTSGGTTTYTSPAGPFAFDTLKSDGTNFMLSGTNGTIEKFDSSGKLTSVVDRDNNNTTYNWSGSQLDNIVDPSGIETKFGYNESGLVNTITDFYNRDTVRTTQLDYTDGQLTSITAPDPGDDESQPETLFGYSAGLMTSYTDADGNITYYAYRGDGTLATETGADGNVATYHAAQSLLVPSGTSGTPGSSTNPWLLVPASVGFAASWDQSNNETISTFDTFGDPTNVENALGNTTSYTRNADGQVTEMTEPAVDNGGGTMVQPTTKYFYYDSNVSSPTYYSGYSSTIGPDLEEEILPDGSIENWTYTAYTASTLSNGGRDDVADSYTDQINGWDVAGGEAVAYTHDSSNGDLTETEQYVNGAASGGGLTSYERSGQNTAADGDDPITTDVYSNSSNSTGIPFGLVLSETNPDGDVTAYSYDAAGNPTATYQGQLLAPVTADGATTWSFSNLPQAGYSLDSYAYLYVNASDTTDYSASGISRSAPDSPSVESLGDGWHYVGRVPLTSSVTVNYSGTSTAKVYLLQPMSQTVYDDQENPISTTDAMGNVTATTYDNLGQPQATSLGEVVDVGAYYGWTAFNNLPQAPGQARTYTLYLDGDPSGASYYVVEGDDSQPTITASVSSVTPLGDGWYQAGIVSVQPGDLSSGIYIIITPASGLTIDHAALVEQNSATVYDAAGNVLSQTDGDGNVTAFGYDTMNRVTSTAQGQILPSLPLEIAPTSTTDDSAMFLDLPAATEAARTFTLYVHAASTPTDATSYAIWDDTYGWSGGSGAPSFTPETTPVLVAAGVYEVGTITLDASDSSPALVVQYTGGEVTSPYLTTAEYEIPPYFDTGDEYGYSVRAFDDLPEPTGQARIFTLYMQSDADVVEFVWDSAGGSPTFTADPGGTTSVGGGWYELGTILVAADDDSSYVVVDYSGSPADDIYLSTADWGPESPTSATFNDLPVATYQARTFPLYLQTSSDGDGFGGLSDESYGISDEIYGPSDGSGNEPLFTPGTIISVGDGWYEVGMVTINENDPSSSVTIGYGGGADVTDARLTTAPLSFAPDGSLSGASFANLPQLPGQERSYTVYAESTSDTSPDGDTFSVWDSPADGGTSDLTFTATVSPATLLGQNWFEVGTVTLGSDDTSSTITVACNDSDISNYCLLQDGTSMASYTPTSLVASESDALGNTTTIGYDSLGEQTSVTGPAVAAGTPVTTDVFDAIGRTTAEFDPLGNITAGTYDMGSPAAGETTVTTMQGQELPLSEADSADFQNLALPNSEAGTYRYYNIYAYSTTPLSDLVDYWVNAPGLDAVPASFSAVTPLGNGWYCLGTAEYNGSADNSSMTVTFSEPESWSGSAPTLPTEIALLQAVSTDVYDANGNLLKSTDAAFNPTTYAYNHLGLPEQQQVTTGAPWLGPVYDKAGQMVIDTDLLGNETTYQYNDLGEVVTTVAPVSGTTTDSYNADGQLVSETDAVETSAAATATTTYAYDMLGNQVSVSLPDPSTGDAGGPTTTYVYDFDSQLVSETDSMWNHTAYTYDAFGNQVSQSLPDPTGYGAQDLNSPTTTFTYDGNGDMVALTDPDGNTTSWTYDAAGNETGQSNYVAESYNSDGSINYTTADYSYGYDLDGNLTSSTDPDGNTNSYTYDSMNRELSDTITPPGEGTATDNTITYDVAGHMTSASSAFPETISGLNGDAAYAYEYGPSGSLDAESTQVGALGYTAPDVALASTYDNNGNRLTLTANIGGIISGGTVTGGYGDFENSYMYNALGEMTLAVQEATLAVQDGSLGNTPAPKYVAMSYGADGLLAGIDRYDLSSQVDVSNLNAYLGGTIADGDATTATELNLIAARTLAVSSSYGYDSDMNLTDLNYTSTTLTGSRPLPAYHWDYNTDGQVTDEYSRADTSGSYSTYSTWANTNYGYDDDGQLTSTTYSSNFANSPGNTSQTFDANGNRTSDSAATGANNELLFDGTYYYQYDANGNRTERYENSVNPSLDGNATNITTYTWNSSNELVEIQYQALAGDYPETAATFEYDAFGRMVGEATASGTETFVYDGQNLLLALGGDGGVLERELNGPAVDQVLASETVNPLDYSESGYELPGTVNWLLTDRQGSVRDVAQIQSDGTPKIVDHVVYDGFGQITWQSSATDQPRFGYDGMQTLSLGDPSSPVAPGLNYDNARWYDPTSGNFISRDPIGFGGGDSNTNRYCANSPTNYTDPTGEWSLSRWVYTGDGDAPDDVYDAATGAAGQYYVQNAGETHQALNGLGTAGRATSAVLRLAEGEDLHNQIMQGGAGAGQAAIPAGVPVPNFVAAQPGNAPPAQAQNGGQWFTRQVIQFGAPIISIVGILTGSGGASGGETPVDGGHDEGQDAPGEPARNGSFDERSWTPDQAQQEGLSDRSEQELFHSAHETEEHHPLMQGDQFRQFWKDRGLSDSDVENWTVPLDKDVHQAMTNSGWWDDELTSRIADLEESQDGQLATPDQVRDIASQLLKEAGEWSP